MFSFCADYMLGRLERQSLPRSYPSVTPAYVGEAIRLAPEVQMETKIRNAKTFRRAAWGCLLSAICLTAPFGAGPSESLRAMPAAIVIPNCTVAELSAFNIWNMTITSAAQVAASAADPAYCDVIGSVATDGEGAGPGAATFRAKLPVAWNNKYLATGPGGVSGSLVPSMNPVDVAASIRKGYAFVTTDTGHRSSPLDASWALMSPGIPAASALVDYFYRAQHQVAVATKQLVTAFYGGQIERSYFDGCSNAGRNALVAAMRYPDDYDGIIAGAPYMDQRGTQIAGYKNAKAFLNAFIPPGALPAIDAAVRESCDGADGVFDGLIQNPAACSFDPNRLVPNTLTQAQADALNVFIGAIRDDRGRLVFPGSAVSDLSAPGGFVPWAELGPPFDPTSAQPWGAAAPLTWRIADSMIRHIVVRDSNFNANLDWPQTDGVVSGEAARLFDKRTEVGNSDRAEKLVPYLNRGNRVLLYYGFSDQAISPYRTIWFYQDLAETFGTYRNVQKHARLFMAPGMLHCGGGPGPNSFDTLTALEDWVEHGIAPEEIIATKYVNDNPAQGVARTMPLCKFPEKARYDGVGDPRDAASWTCPSSDRSLLEIGPNGIQAGLHHRERHRQHDRQ
jgi:feruloyl esterase